ncbi:MAG TPA: MarP family serine protease [Streptosporangiaceae bacterium]
MSGDVLDLLLLVVVAAFAVSGYRQGFIVGILSFLGFVGGALLGAEFGPDIAHAIVGGQTQQDIVAVILLVSFAVIGQFIASAIGAAMRSTVTWHSATVLDSIGGSLVSIVSVLLIAWVVGSVLNGSPFPVVDQQVNNSITLKTLDRFMPRPAKTMFSDFRRLLDSNSTYAEVFSGIGEGRILAVPAPDPSVLRSAGYQQARTSVVKVRGVAPSCGKEIEGSGFVISQDHILTNAHVVAGVTQHQTVTTTSGQQLSATVVFYDPQVDVAVLYVPGLNLHPLQFAGQASVGDDAVVAGYPLDATSLQQAAARIGDIQNAVGPNIYQTTTVNRQIYEIRAVVEEGNSGGPLLSPAGQVDGVVFAAAVGVSDTGFALTSTEVLPDARTGATATVPVSTQMCD